MQRRRTHILVAAVVALVGALGVLPRTTFGGRRSAVPVVVLRLIGQGQVRLAHREITKLLDANPSDPELHAAYGAMLTEASLFPDAVMAFEDAGGSAWYARRGRGYHARALARVGRADEAVALRSVALDVGEVVGDKVDLVARASMVEDLVEGGDLDDAVAAGEDLVLRHPGRTYAWAALAWAQVNRATPADLDAAGWSLFQARRLEEGRELLFLSRARAVYMLEQGRYERAWYELYDFKEDTFKDPEAWWLRLEILRRSGFPEECVFRAEQDRFSYQEDPAFTAVVGRCLADVGRADEARALVAGALETHPGNNRLKAAWVALSAG